MVEGGLRQVSIHVDMTQAGRHGYPIGRIKSEADLHPVRQAFTELALRLRAQTGLPLEYALSFTVTRKNIDDVPEVLRWYPADPERTRVWRMISFQPEADTGRTIFSARPVTPGEVWEKICEGVGLRLRSDVSIFGHPDCNSWASLLVARPSGKILPLLPDNAKFDALLGEVLRKLGGLGVGMRNFMSAAQVASAEQDSVVRTRLAACVFKGAVKRHGQWEAVPMCAMNRQTWSEVYEERLRDPELVRQ